jgi:hypothetical protein
MPAQARALKAQQEGRLLLALQAYQKGQISSIRKAASLYDVPRKTLQYRANGRVARADTRANRHKLTTIEEEVLVRWILSMDERGYPLRISAVRDAARLLLAQRIGSRASIGINWPRNFVNR